MSEKVQQYCGYIALVGRPNVGKSTLLNYILGEKITITSKKPQTTRDCILGVKTEKQWQAIYMDTPGLQHRAQRLLNRHMNRIVLETLVSVDVVVWLISGTHWTPEDEKLLRCLDACKQPIVSGY